MDPQYAMIFLIGDSETGAPDFLEPPHVFFRGFLMINSLG